MLLILADAAADSITPIFGMVGSLGFAVWFGVYTMMFFIPNQQKEHREERKARDDMHASTIKALVDELRTERESYDRWLVSHRQQGN